MAANGKLAVTYEGGDQAGYDFDTGQVDASNADVSEDFAFLGTDGGGGDQGSLVLSTQTA